MFQFKKVQTDVAEWYALDIGDNQDQPDGHRLEMHFTPMSGEEFDVLQNSMLSGKRKLDGAVFSKIQLATIKARVHEWRGGLDPSGKEAKTTEEVLAAAKADGPDVYEAVIAEAYTTIRDRSKLDAWLEKKRLSQQRSSTADTKPSNGRAATAAPDTQAARMETH
jgi:hypothetical protein